MAKITTRALLGAVLLILLTACALPATAAATPPANDDFANAITLSGPAGSVTGTTIESTSESVEPCDIFIWGCGASVWYRWTSAASAATLVSFDTCTDTNFDTTLQVFTGSSLAALELVTEDDGFCGTRSKVFITAVPGTTYYVRVGGRDLFSGTFTLAYPAGAGAGPDVTAPVLDAPTWVGATATSTAGAVVTWTATAIDAVDGTVAVTCTRTSGSTFAPGTTNVTCTATDSSGNTASRQFPVVVTYAWSGVLAPINADGSSVFKLGSTVPVKFRLTGASAGITNLTARITITKLTSAVLGTDSEPTSTSQSTSGNLFRLGSDGTWSYNLATKPLSKGTWRIGIDLGDGVTRTVDISLR